MDWLNVLAKWRLVLAGWQLGTRAKGDPESDAVRDAAEARLILRVEVTAITRLLIEKGVFTAEEFTAAVQDEARLLNEAYARKFPGFRATPNGITLDLPEAAQTMAYMRFKP